MQVGRVGQRRAGGAGRAGAVERGQGEPGGAGCEGTRQGEAGQSKALRGLEVEGGKSGQGAWE